MATKLSKDQVEQLKKIGITGCKTEEDSREKMVEKMSHAVATCFQIKERGFIREGYFADLVLVKEAAYTITKDNILYKCGWSPLEGTQFPYQIHSTFVNGHRVFNNGQFDESEKGQRLQFDRQ